MTTTQLELAAFVTGLALVVFLLTIGVDWTLRWVGRKDPDDVGLQVFLLDDCDDYYGCPMVIDEADEWAEATPEAQAVTAEVLLGLWNSVYADYGATVVHRLCLDKRTAGLPPCADCAPRMAPV